jgi:hypothetical protein
MQRWLHGQTAVHDGRTRGSQGVSGDRVYDPAVSDNGDDGRRELSTKFKIACVLVGLAGAASLAIGLRSAWETEASTAAVLAGAVLIGLALVLSSDFVELSGEYKGSGVKVVREPQGPRLEEWAMELRQASAQAVTTDAGEAPEKLVELTEVVEQVAARFEQEALAERSAEYATWAERLPYLVQTGQLAARVQPPDYRLTTYGEPRMPSIHVNFRWWGNYLVTCKVTTPSGEEIEQSLTGSQYMGGNNFVYGYPHDFEHGLPLEAGTYDFRWINPAQFGPRDEEIAHDLVEVPAEWLAGDGSSVRPEVNRLKTQGAWG